MATPPDLKQDSLVEKLRPDPNQPPSIERRGFLGKSDRSEYSRLYLTRALTEYLEIANADIVHREVDKDPDAGSRIWIKQTAVVRFGPPKEVTAADLHAQSATAENPVACSYSCGGRSMMMAGFDPMMLFFMGPYIWWAMAAQFCGATAFMLGSGMAGAARIARGGFMPPHRALCGRDGKIILLGPEDYKVISCR
ncbi:MAG TPA: hypothetical protein VLX44_01315 [Xanthobacteraceae bacterium]|nr:hypothetical protein [Xanthobacteraceae bacterium]